MTKINAKLTVAAFVVGIWASPLSSTEGVAAFSTTSIPFLHRHGTVAISSSSSSLKSTASEQHGVASMGQLDDENANDLLFQRPSKSKAVLVDAYAPWCGPCKLIEPMLERCAERHAEKLDVIRYNVEGANNSKVKVEMLLQGVMIKGLPALALYDDGKPLALHSGMITDDKLEDWLDEHLFSTKTSASSGGSEEGVAAATAVREETVTTDIANKAPTDDVGGGVDDKRGFISFTDHMGRDDYAL